jgi:hypothetical protein
MDALLKLLLAAGVIAVILDAIITNVVASVRENRAHQRELKGLLRMLYVEIEANRGEAELLLSAENPQEGYWTNTVYKDDTWKEVRSRLAQLLPDADHFDQLIVYYARNESQEKGILRVIEIGSSFKNPDNAFAKLNAELLEQQMDLAVDALEMIKKYIPGTPVGRETVENANQEIKRLQRELDSERDRREQEQ